MQVRDRATLYLNMLGGEGGVVETDNDVKDFLFGSWDVPLVNLETSLKNYVSVLVELNLSVYALCRVKYYLLITFLNTGSGAFRRAF